MRLSHDALWHTFMETAMNQLRKKFLIAALLTVGSVAQAQAQAQDYYESDSYEPDYAYEFSPRAGDAALDQEQVTVDHAPRNRRQRQASVAIHVAFATVAKVP